MTEHPAHPTSPEPRQLGDDFLRDPGAVYRALRTRGPIHHVVLPNGMRSWLITDYHLARRALADPLLGKDARDATALFARQAAAHGGGGFAMELPEHMLNADPPDHDRLRALVNRAFTPRAVARMTPRIEAITAQLLDALESRAADGTAVVELLDGFAYPLPIAVISDMLGIPASDRDQFRAWSTILGSSIGPDSEEIAGALSAMNTYLLDQLARRREHPDDSMITGLLQATEDGDRLSENELVSTLFLLLVAGYETTANLIGNGVHALLRNPAQLALLRADPALLPGAVEEFLRHTPPINVATLRHTTAPWSAGGTTVPAGEFVMVALLAANNDPARYPEPDRLDLTRPTGGHVTFGHGIHFCIGAPLARLEGAIAFRQLLARFPRLALAGEPDRLTWRGSLLMHGLTELPVHLH